MRGFEQADCIWNGGNVYPVEVDGSISDYITLSRLLYEDPESVQKYRLTLANTVNIGRLLPHTFLYMYAFSRLRKKVYGDIYYAMSSNNAILCQSLSLPNMISILCRCLYKFLS